MSAVTPSFIRLPDDSANTGKKVRARSRIVGSDTVHEHVVCLTYPEIIVGVYYGHSGLLNVLENAHASDSGFIYLINPIGSSVELALRRIKFQSSPTIATASATAPRITLERFTFTGTHTGALLSPSKRRTTDADATGRLSLEKTGLTVTGGNVIRGFLVPSVLTGIGPGTPSDLIWEPIDNEGETIVASGEGILHRQADNGTGSDTRVFIVDYTWLEYSLI